MSAKKLSSYFKNPSCYIYLDLSQTARMIYISLLQDNLLCMLQECEDAVAVTLVASDTMKRDLVALISARYRYCIKASSNK